MRWILPVPFVTATEQGTGFESIEGPRRARQFKCDFWGPPVPFATSMERVTSF
jgi:hypothetical protein